MFFYLILPNIKNVTGYHMNLMGVSLLFVSNLKEKETKWLIVAYISIAIFLSPLYIFGDNAHIRIHDNMDSNIAWYKVLTESGEIFGDIDATIPQVINGKLSRGALGTEWQGIVWLHANFPSMVAYALSQTITRLIAFLGMYLLLKKHFVKDEKAYLIRIGVALAFAFTPFWPSGMLSTLGHPLALCAFLNIRERSHTWKDWLTLALLPFYASIVLGFFFFLVAMGFLWLRDVIVRREWNFVFLGSIAFMTAIFLLTDYRLVYSLLIPHEATHRIEFISSRHDFWHSIRLSLKNFTLGHTHVMTVHTVVILPMLILGLTLALIYRKNLLGKRYIFLFGLNIALSTWYAFWFNNIWKVPKQNFDMLVTFNFARFHFLRPLVIYLGFAIACYLFWRIGKRWRKFAIAIVLAQIIVLIPFNEEIRYRGFGSPSFKEFYAVEQFEEIKQFIGKPQRSYRVASIGLHPAIAQYNGFFTLDTYNNFYPLTYKHQFRKIIAKELEKNKSLKKYFDTWGGRCYIFVDELGKDYEWRKNSKKIIKNLELNTEPFKEMGGEYFISSVPIENSKENQLQLVKQFNHPNSAWEIFLYKAL
jgi:hypothetical protein